MLQTSREFPTANYVLPKDELDFLGHRTSEFFKRLQGLTETSASKIKGVTDGDKEITLLLFQYSVLCAIQEQIDEIKDDLYVNMKKDIEQNKRHVQLVSEDK